MSEGYYGRARAIFVRHLPDIDGDHLIGQLQSNPALRETMCIVTSSDLRLQEVIDVVGRTIARVPVKEHIANYQAARTLIGKGKSSATKAAKKSALKKAKPKA